jgi:hypothetical protein
VAVLVQELCQATVAQLQAAARLPVPPTYRFADEATSGPVLKSRTRGVVSARHGEFVAVEVIHAGAPGPQSKPEGSAALARLVPRRSGYAFDLIAQVGVQTFLDGHTLAQVQQTLRGQSPGVEIPLSTLQDLKMKFLYYLGRLHQEAAPGIKAYLRQRGHVQWAIDGTLEPGTRVFFGVKEPESGWLLACRKIPTENRADIEPCLRATAADYGEPDRIWHDLSPVLSEACPAALPQVAHFVCHFHLAADVGEDLYRGPQAALGKAMLALKLNGRLKEQRRGQHERLQAQVRQGSVAPVLQALWAGQTPSGRSFPTLMREILLAAHLWLLDFASEGHRQGFPFDPHLLYFHRRVVRLVTALDVLRAQPKLWVAAPAAVRNFASLLTAYVADPQVQQSAAWFEKAAGWFERFRAALRLGAHGPAPVHEAYALSAPDVRAAQSDLTDLREELRRLARSEEGSAQDRQLRTIVLTHLDRYWPLLGWTEGGSGEGGMNVRTTNAIETHWTQGKRKCRQIHGRSRLTRDWVALPAEFMLVPNLLQESYQQQVLGGGLDQLPHKFADLALPPGGFHQWRQAQRPEPFGRLPKRVLREDQFIEELLNFWPGLSPTAHRK